MIPDLEALPDEIRTSQRAVVWKREDRDGKPTKVPYQAHRPESRAAVNKPQTWRPFTEAVDSVLEGKADGVGIVLGNGLVGIDLDHVRDPATGTIARTARALIRHLDSYTELSPSQTGLHVLVHGTMPTRGTRANGVELYAEGRYFTVTGQHLAGTPSVIHERTAQLAQLHARVRRRRPSTPPPVASPTFTLTDAALLAKAMTAANGARFAALWAGDVSSYNGDDSAADLALCNLLAFWTGRDAAQIDRLFRQSGLMRPKWTSRRGKTTYGALTIEKAIADCRDSYTPGITVEITDASDEAVPTADPPPIETAPADTWPTLHEDALVGLFGDLVRSIAPHTEADPVALLGHALGEWGNLIGRTPHAVVGADVHHANENVAIIGKTSIGRKGSAWSEIHKVMADVDPDWASSRVQSGLSTGEGLIYHVRDARSGQCPIKVKGRIVSYETVVEDAGVSDKRLCILESEFGRTLRVSRREGNTLSAAVRQAFDSGDLRVLTRNSPIQATGAHVSIIAHVTPRELKQELKTTDMASGFANRFLMLLARRSRFLPHGGSMDVATHAALVRRFTEATDAARRIGMVTRTREADDYWAAVYSKITRERSGLVGDVCTRGPAHVLRLSLIYALADGSSQIRLDHLKAALALWQYAEASALYVFKRRTGVRLSDYLLALLRAHPEGQTRKQIRDALGRNRQADEISEALQLLLDYGLARFAKEQPSTGPPTTRWVATADFDTT